VPSPVEGPERPQDRDIHLVVAAAEVPGASPELSDG
jgi:hypothetical protein